LVNAVDCGLTNRFVALPGGASDGAAVVRSAAALVVLVNMLNLPNRFVSTPVVLTLAEVVTDVVVVVAPVVDTASLVVA